MPVQVDATRIAAKYDQCRQRDREHLRRRRGPTARVRSQPNTRVTLPVPIKYILSCVRYVTFILIHNKVSFNPSQLTIAPVETEHVISLLFGFGIYAARRRLNANCQYLQLTCQYLQSNSAMPGI
jgi:hypothetical protein